MKVIDLLNKIANGEELPRKIKYHNYVYYLQCKYCYRCDKLDDIFESNFIFEYLNDEIEIIEDTPKEDNKIKNIPYTFDLNFVYCNINKTAKEGINKTINDIINKINEIIDKVNGE